MKSKKIFLRIVSIIFLAILMLLLTYGAFFIWKLNKTENKIILDKSESASVLSTLKSLSGQSKTSLKTTKGKINILVLGIAGKDQPGQNLTDTIMVLSVDTQTNKVAFLSIPRDLYVQIPDEEIETKINSVYQFGVSRYKNDGQEKIIKPIKQTVENILSTDINYWAIVNFEGFKKAIDALGGINIMNERDIYDSRFPGPNYSYETFVLKKGFHHLDGQTALKYARMRHGDPEGDFGRAKRQQQVMQAVKNKVFSTGTFLNALALNELLDTLGENIQTNLEPGELGEFLKLLQKLDTVNISTNVLTAWDKNSLLKVSHIYYENTRVFILIPRVGNWSEVQDLFKNIFDLRVIEKRKEKISQENARIVMINESGNNEIFSKIQKLLKENFAYRNISIASNKNNYLSEKTFAYSNSQEEKPYTLDELVKKLPCQIDYNLNKRYAKIASDYKADIVIAVGKDLISRYNMAEDSFEDYKNSQEINEYLEFKTNN